MVPDGIDYKFLKAFKLFLLSRLKKKNEQFIICTGGGKLAREYMNTLAKEKINVYTQDLMGIACTRLNAQLFANFLFEASNKEIPTTLEEVADLAKNNKIIVCGGLESGRTTDGTTASIAEYLNVKQMINITNVKGLYEKDPKKYRNAKLIKKISYAGFKKLMQSIKEHPGQHFVLDSLAAEIIERSKITAIIVGKNIRNLAKVLNKEKFIGTVIGD